MLKRASLAAVMCLAASALLPALASSDLLVYFGTYTGTVSKGIYVSRLHIESDAMGASEPQLAAAADNPSFLATAGNGAYLYAVNEVAAGTVTAFGVDKQSGKLTELNRQSTRGADPAHVSVDRSGRTVFVANYTGGSVAAFPIDKDGRLGSASSFFQHTGHSVNPERQAAPHAHQILVDPHDRFAYVADLGLDKILIYQFDAAKQALARASPPSASLAPGAGPRHLAFDLAGHRVYVIDELDCTIAAFNRDAGTGALTPFQTVSSLPPGERIQKGYSTAEIEVAPSGKFLYGSNRGHDSISVFAIDRFNGKLTFVANTPTGGKTPRGFGITPDGRLLVAANQNSDLVTFFLINAASGKLTPLATSVKVGKPVDVKFVE